MIKAPSYGSLAFLVLVADIACADLVVANGRVFTGTEAGVVEGTNVIVVDDRIESVSIANVDTADVEVIDASGMTVLPGLIDAHFHAFFDRREGIDFPDSELEARADITDRLQGVLQDYLEQGFTSVVSPFDFWPLVIELRDRLASGELQGPRLFAAGGVFTGPGEHALCRGQQWCAEHLSVQIADSDSAREWVRRYAQSGVDILVHDSLHDRPSILAPDIVRAMIDEAHQRGLRVLLHGVDVQHVDNFVSWEVDGFINPPRGTDDVDDSLLARAGAEKLPVVMTLEELLEDGPIRQNMLTLLNFGAVPVFGPDMAGTRLSPREVVGMMTEALSNVGLSNTEVLRSATYDAARVLLGREDLGALEPGYLADIIIVEGNPLTNLQALQDVVVVIKEGEIILDKRLQ